MRASVVRVMSGVSILVVGLSLRASRHTSDAALGVQPAGVVGGTLVSSGSVDTATPSPFPTRTLGSSPSPSSTPRPSAPARSPRRTVHRAAATPSPTRSPKPAPPPRITVNGAPADTPYGPVQVQIDLRGGHIIAARAVEYPTDSNRDAEINSYAIPQLDDETVQADSDQIDSVSGATYTSDGYRLSLQSALDAAQQAGAR